MRERSARLIRLSYGIILSYSAVIAGICLMAACIRIYQSGGEQIYTPQKVAAAFSPIALPVYLFLVLTVVGFFLHFFLPAEKKRKPVEKQYALMLRKQYEKADLAAGDPKLLARIRSEQRWRKAMLIISAAILGIGCVVFLLHALNADRYADLSQATNNVVESMYYLLPCMAIPFGFSLFAVYYCRGSIRRELELVKQFPRKENIESATPAASGETGILVGRLILFAVAITFVLYGFFAGGTGDVLAKAVAICTECVGLG